MRSSKDWYEIIGRIGPKISSSIAGEEKSESTSKAGAILRAALLISPPNNPGSSSNLERRSKCLSLIILG